MIGGQIKKNWLRDPDHVYLGVVCYPKAVYKIWWLSLQPFWRYGCGRQNSKWVMWSKFEVSISTHYDRIYERRNKVLKMGWFRVV